MGTHWVGELGETDDEEIIEQFWDEWAEPLNEISEEMQRLGLGNARNLIASFLEQVGDISQNADLLVELCEEAHERMADQNAKLAQAAAELEQNPAEMPDIIIPRRYESLPQEAQAHWNTAKRLLLAGEWTSSATSACLSVEPTLHRFFAAVTKKSPDGQTWDSLEKELKRQDRIAERFVSYYISPTTDVRLNFRNPLVHGRLVYDHREQALEAFLCCQIALSRMAEYLFDRGFLGSR